jgi:hypothetical protein
VAAGDRLLELAARSHGREIQLAQRASAVKQVEVGVDETRKHASPLGIDHRRGVVLLVDRSDPPLRDHHRRRPRPGGIARPDARPTHQQLGGHGRQCRDPVCLRDMDRRTTIAIGSALCLALSAGLCLALAAGCDRNVPRDEPATVEPPPPPPPPATQPIEATAPPADEGWKPSSDPKVARFLGLEAPKPVTWIEHPPPFSMRKAQYTVPGRDGSNAADVIVYYFGAGGGGTVEDNIERWRQQFEPDDDGLFPEPFIDRFEADGMPVTLVELGGSWMKMGARWYTADQLFISAIVETSFGLVFIRFAGDTATIEANRGDFLAMLEGLRKAES